MTAAQRKAAERTRRRAAGLVKVEIWTRPEHRRVIQRYAARKNKITAPPPQG